MAASTTARPPSPNYFIAVPITDPYVLGRIEAAQEAMTGKELTLPWAGVTDTAVFKDAMVPQGRLHFTVQVIHLKSQEEVQMAQMILAQVCSTVHQELVRKPIDIKIKGLHYFGKSAAVLYAEPEGPEPLARLGKIRDLFQVKFQEKLGIPIDTRPFHPHLTIAKVNGSWKLKAKNICSLPPEMWEGMEGTDFGFQRVKTIELLQVGSSDRWTGQYRCHGKFDF